MLDSRPLLSKLGPNRFLISWPLSYSARSYSEHSTRRRQEPRGVFGVDRFPSSGSSENGLSQGRTRAVKLDEDSPSLAASARRVTVAIN